MQRGDTASPGSESLARRHADLSCVRLSRTLRCPARAVAMRSRPARRRFRCVRLIQTHRNARCRVPPRWRESTNAAHGHVPRGPLSDEKTGLQAGSSARSPRAIFNDVPYHLSPHVSAMSGRGAPHIQSRDRSPRLWRNRHTRAGCCRKLPVVIWSAWNIAQARVPRKRLPGCRSVLRA